MSTNIGVVITTFNRLEKLKKALDAYRKQTYIPKCVIVVDNASSDGTDAFLKEWKEQRTEFDKEIITLDKNTGGAGGFFAGEQYVMSRDDVSWVLIADDDAYPEANYLEGLNKYICSHCENDYSIVCGKVLEHNSPVNIHRTFLKSKWARYFQSYASLKEYEKEEFNPDFVSYVGILINKTKMNKVGLVNKDYFIWYDDTEHSERLKKVGKIVCLPAFTIIHDVGCENDSLSWKNYYGFRNNVDFMKKHFRIQMPFVVVITLLKAILCPLKGKSIAESKLRINAIYDGLAGRLGKHPIYKPGWKP